ncbi:DUF4783 domain-containing protein [bacterium]|nr:DUF4783 domain-containing protein [bacterium]
MTLIQKIVIVIVIVGCVGTTAFAADMSKSLNNAFKGGNAGILNNLLPKDGRVHLSISAVGIKPGNYSRQQAIALLRKAFGDYQTVSFNLQSNSGAIRAGWVVRHKASGKRKSVTLYISVENRKLKSVITSIRGG